MTHWSDRSVEQAALVYAHVKPILTQSAMITGVVGAAFLSEERLSNIARYLCFRRFVEGEDVFKVGEPANRFFLVMSGSISVYVLDGYGQFVVAPVNAQK